jgi:hypothetical protein
MSGLPQRAFVDVTPNSGARAATQRAFFLAQWTARRRDAMRAVIILMSPHA